MSEIGNFVRRLRGDMSLREAARRSGLSHSYIDALEKGKHPKTKAPIVPAPDSLRKLAAAYNYPYEDLLRVAGIIEEDVVNKDVNEAIIKEIVNKYNVDLTVPGNREKLEQIIQLVLDDRQKKK